MTETIFDGSSTRGEQPADLDEYLWRILGVQARGPELRILEHLPRREAHDRIDVVTDERALERARGLVRVHDAWGHRHQIPLTLARSLQFDGPLLDPLLQFVMRLLQ